MLSNMKLKQLSLKVNPLMQQCFYRHWVLMVLHSIWRHKRLDVADCLIYINWPFTAECCVSDKGMANKIIKGDGEIGCSIDAYNGSFYTMAAIACFFCQF